MAGEISRSPSSAESAPAVTRAPAARATRVESRERPQWGTASAARSTHGAAKTLGFGLLSIAAASSTGMGASSRGPSHAGWTRGAPTAASRPSAVKKKACCSAKGTPKGG